MTDQGYERLAEALDRLPNGFPQTPSGVEIRLLRKIYSPEQAAIAGQLGREMEPVDVLAERFGMSVKVTRKTLMAMARRGQVWFDKQAGKPRFRLAPFVVGVFEAQLDAMDHELAHLVEEYMTGGGAAGIMGPEPALHRVVPTQGTVKSEWILPYDDVRAVLLAAKSFTVNDCICRVQQDLLDSRHCSYPLGLCLSFSQADQSSGPGNISQEEALAILDEAEEVGLVHTVSNVIKGLGYVCNCCGCCCGILRGITEHGLEHSVAQANYYATIDPDQCTGCGTCLERCEVGAISEGEGVSIVDRKRCIGCGLCVSTCPTGAATLQRKPENQIVHPPADYAAWERDRLENRGLAG